MTCLDADDAARGHVGPEREDGAGALESRLEGGVGRRQVLALLLDRVGAVDLSGGQLEENLAVPATSADKFWTFGFGGRCGGGAQTLPSNPVHRGGARPPCRGEDAGTSWERRRTASLFLLSPLLGVVGKLRWIRRKGPIFRST